MLDSVDILALCAKTRHAQLAAIEETGLTLTTESRLTDPVAALTRHEPAVVLIDGSAAAGLDAIRLVKSDPTLAQIPVAAIDAEASPEALRALSEAGVDEIFERGTDPSALPDRLRPLFRLSGMELELVRRCETAREFGVEVDPAIAQANGRSGHRLLIVGASAHEIGTLCPRLPKSDIGFESEPDPYRARHRVEGGDGASFDGALFYLRDEETREKCIYFCRAVRNDRRLFDLPVVLIMGNGSYPDPALAHETGANLVAQAPVDCDLIETHLRLLLRGSDRRRALGRRITETLAPGTADESGSIYSDAFARSHLRRLAAAKAEHGIASSAVLFFVPTIGEVAAIYGIEESALLRRQVASWISALVRVEDMVGRCGVDDFLAVLPSTTPADAELVRRRVVGVLQQSEFRLTDSLPVPVGVYVQSGIVEIQHTDAIETIVSRASDLLQ